MNLSLTDISRILAKESDQKQVEDFLRQLLTEHEARELSQRWDIVKMLNSGIPQREIAKKLGVSLCKITRGSRELKKEKSAFHSVLKKKGENDE